MTDTSNIRSRAGGGGGGAGSSDDGAPAAKRKHDTAGGGGGSILDAQPPPSSSSPQQPAPLLDSLLALLRRLPPQRPLTAPPRAALAALFLAVAVAWWACVGAGVRDYEGRPAGVKRVAHALLWYDDAVVRPAGSAVPFVALLVRAGAVAAAAAARRRQQQPQQQGQQQPQKPPSPALVWSCLAVYCAIAGARAAVYGVNLVLARALRGFHLLSDHLLLTGSIVTCLAVELAALCADIRDARAANDARAAGGLAAVGAALAALGALTLGDGYFTARFFHHPSESITTAAVVTLFFYAPVGAWLWRERAKQSASV